MPVVCGTVITPSQDTDTPATPVDASALLTARDFSVPPKPRYYLSELATYVCRWEEDEAARNQAIQAAQRVLERECERGRLRGVRIGRNIVIPRAEWERYVVDQNTLCDN